MLSISDFQQPFYELKQQGTSAHPKEVTLIVIGWQPKGKGEPQLSAPQLQDLFFGEKNSVAHWFDENSQGRYKIVPHPTHPVLGPFESVYDWPFYWRSSDPSYVKNRLTPEQWAQNPYKVPPPANDPHYYVDQQGTSWYLSDEGYINGHPQSWAEAILKAADQINFADLDRNGDGNLTADECLIVIVKAQATNWGSSRPVVGSEVPNPTDLVVNGVKINSPTRWICELYAGPPHGTDDLAVAAEEVLHLAANLADQYPDGNDRLNNDPRRPGQLALTDAEGRPVHIDPFHKLKWGWLNPQLADHSGRYTLHEAALTGDAIIICNPYFGTNEFFILENRWRGISYDRFRDNSMKEGLALWHCIQDQQLSNNWARRALHLKRVDPRLDVNGKIKWDLTLLDGSDPIRSQDLSDDSNPQNLRFRNEMPSRIRIRNVSATGPTVTVDLEVPLGMGEIGTVEGHVKMIRVHAHGSGYGPPAYSLPEDCIVTFDSDPGSAFGIDISGENASAGRRMFDLLRVALDTQKTVRIEYKATTAIGGQVIRVIESW